jgi:hypothetical protein
MPVQQWLRHEWQRSGLLLYQANEACGVKNAATRKYLTQDWLWYWPPGLMMERLAAYANDHGAESGWPYFSLDGEKPVDGQALGFAALPMESHPRPHECLEQTPAA